MVSIPYTLNNHNSNNNNNNNIIHPQNYRLWLLTPQRQQPIIPLSTKPEVVKWRPHESLQPTPPHPPNPRMY